MSKLIRFATLCVMLIAANAMAELQIDITRGGADASPIAVVPFSWSDPNYPPYDVAAVVGADLARSGRFAPMPVKDMLQKPTTAQLSILVTGEFSVPRWLLSGRSCRMAKATT